MRPLLALNEFRRTDPAIVRYFHGIGDNSCGVFEVPSPVDGKSLHVIASALGEWDHVSVSRETRCPNWPEMSFIKRLFFMDGETAMELHVPTSDHVNDHPYCLHLWRPHGVDIPRPPGWMVGGVSRKEADRLAQEAGV